MKIFNYSLRHNSGRIRESKSNLDWLFIRFYGQPNSSKWKENWDLLHKLNPENIAWYVMGDFNEILYQHEKKGAQAWLESLMNNFQLTLSMNELPDVNCVDSLFTWSNNHMGESYTKERLDRVVTNNWWKNLFLVIRVKDQLPTTSSNHKPMLLSISSESIWRVKKRYFKFEACDTNEEDYEKIIKKE